LLQAAGVVGVGEVRDPVGGGGEQDPVPGLASPDRQADSEVSLAGAGRPRNTTFSFAVTKSRVARKVWDGSHSKARNNALSGGIDG
jgi:hypothetical protein